MRKLRAEMTAFFRELYVDEQKVLVFGEGAARAKLMLVGEAPGERETLAGRPFVGRAGKNLDDLLAASGIARESVYITNVVKFRPTRTSEAGHVLNRTPTREEIELSLPWLEREIALVAPRVVATLGNVPLKALLGHGASIGALHGRRIEGEKYAIFPMYHPAAIIYNPALHEAFERDGRALGALVGAK